jgi:D-alanyl-D-alanine carboxypeptidase
MGWRGPAVALVALAALAGCGDESGGTGDGGSPATGGAGGQTTSAGGSGGEGGIGGADPCIAWGEALQAALDASLVSEGRDGGTVAAVLTPQCRWTGATGESASGVPLEATNLVRIGSVTKTYVAAAFVALADTGALSLDATLDTWVSGVPNGETITVRQLLQHTAGVYNYTNDTSFINAALAAPDTPVAPQVMVDVAVANGPVFAPGTDWGYSNTGYILLGMILQQVTGEPPAQAIRAILDPLGIDRTFLDGEETLPEPLAHGWGPGGIDWTYALHPSVPWTAGSTVAEVGDLVDWADALYDGDAISPTARAEMLSFVPAGAGGEYGLGVSRSEIPALGGTVIGHSGGIPAFSTLMFYAVDRDIAFATVVNSAAGDPAVALFELAPVALEAP